MPPRHFCLCNVEAAAAIHVEKEGRRLDLMVKNEELSRFFSMSIDMLAIAGFDGYFKRLNPAWEHTLGWTQAELRASPYLDFVHPEDREATVAEATKLSQGLDTIHFENRYRAKDGSYRWLSWTASQSVAEQLIYAVARDVTAQRRENAALKESLERTRRMEDELRTLRADAERRAEISESVLNNIAEGVSVFDDHGNLTFNPAAQRIIGRGAVAGGPEVWAKAYGVFLPDKQTPCPPQDMPSARAMRGESVDDLELFIRHADAPQGIWILASARPLLDAAGRARGGVTVFRDMTVHKRAEEEIREANRELEAFAYTVSHDLRAPLRAINGFVRILLDEHGSQLQGEARRYLDLVASNSQLMGRLVDDLLQFSRLSRQPLRRQPVQTRQVVDRALDQLQSSMLGRQIEVSIGGLPDCTGDASLLEQVFVNLIGNAIKYSRGRTPARVEVGSRPDPGGHSVYFVKDNGTGFDMRYAHKLFGVFQRLHRSEEYEGTGVGLAIVQRIVHRHGGRIWPEAEVDRGATFFFTLGGDSLWQAKAA